LAVRRSRLYSDAKESLFAEAGDFLIPRNAGELSDAHHIAEIGQVLAGMAEGRTSDEQITLFKSLGLAIEDLASADMLYEQAVKRSVGQWIEWDDGEEADDDE
jgi:alanine dehydrogenase